MLKKLFGQKPVKTPDVSRVLKPVAEQGPRLKTKRSSQRQDTWKVCEIEFPSGFRLSGVLVDLSATGARVRFRTRGNAVPGQVVLNISDTGQTYRCETVWQDQFEAGFRFTESRDPATSFTRKTRSELRNAIIACKR